MARVHMYVMKQAISLDYISCIDLTKSRISSEIVVLHLDWLDYYP